ncbi:putative AbiEii toxin of type IV toxin-antitoxin system [Palleronia aestuarii]|uniref:Putative AbiEii toxin of type IV toxin-antitoxin system n=1 Tax=Palleronia aestuarii TaxID=568105 RepID=A0A2W7MTK9_9RHOB|nr:AAA family ATPase [Palleronia aestuarii]PZX11308.1 putative AbiEii toxin of type IV toxin-antitoxin system [Palleronia aestuarii]
MPKPSLFVQPAARNVVQVEADTALILLGDNWNDYSYRTLYTLYYKQQGTTHRVGTLKILKEGQREGRPPLRVGEKKGPQLKKKFVSLGTSIDYYIRLIELDLLNSVREFFNDLSSHPELREAFAKEPGLKTSLYREHSRPEEFYNDINRTVAAGGVPPGEDEFKLSFTAPSSKEPLSFSLGRTESKAGGYQTGPSRREGIIVGPNGVGKTHLLASIARVAYAPPAEREQLTNVDGTMADGPGFPNILAVSYSSFDSFVPPMLEGDDPTERRADFIAGRGRYIYLGLRDPATLIEGGDVQPRLITQVEMAETFANHIARIRELDRFNMFARITQPVLDETSVRANAGIPPNDAPEEEDYLTRDEFYVEQLERWIGPDPAAAFLNLSSGHKIVMHQLVGMTAMLQRHGLVLIDEPETHLHPPLLAALMSSIRRLLLRQHAYALVATHSPVVVQEALASQVAILASREPMIVKSPSIETYGENVGALSREVFGFYPTVGDYRNVLDRMVREYQTVEEVEEALGSCLSSQALAHVMATISRRTRAEKAKD